jgi:uncharacterized membrane protein
MNKEQFLASLQEHLNGLAREDIAERVAFYSEAIDDRMEDGLPEEEAVAQLGTVDEIAARILNEIPCARPVKEKRQMGALEIVLLILGSPIWISLLAAGFSIVISIYAVIWSIVASVWAIGVSLAASVFGCILLMVFLFMTGNVTVGLAALAVALFCAGLSIFTFFGSKYVTIGAAILTKKSVQWIIRLFKRKDGAK